ncbi:MAG: alanine racemase [Ruminococcaceae bacterium]|nr:alanine racemase [Oscillospiraceae bacterium]
MAEKHSYLKRTWAEISLDRLAQNFRRIRAGLADGVKIMSVVKADAYGHGATVVAPELQRLGSDAFAVSNIEEAVVLRRSGITRPILVLGWVPPAWADVLLREQIETAVFSLESAQKLSEEAGKIGGTVKVHLKIDTGMGRLGIRASDEASIALAVAEIAEIAVLPNLQIVGLFTHFSTADEPASSLTEQQFHLFCAVRDGLRARGIEIAVCHCANSAAAALHPEYACDMVRAGVSLYGLSPDNCPDGELAAVCGGEPVMTLKTTVVQRRQFFAGDTVSYGAKTLERDAEIAVIPVGYADGYPRLLSNCGTVGIGSKRVPIVGKVCMDMTMIDVSDVEAGEGTEVLLFGKTDEAWIPAEAVAEAAGTIGYELVCCIGRRVARVYIKDQNEIRSVRLTTA